jgi:hypothetical protein
VKERRCFNVHFIDEHNIINKVCIKEKTLKVKAYLPSYLIFWANKGRQKTSLHKKKSVVPIYLRIVLVRKLC